MERLRDRDRERSKNRGKRREKERIHLKDDTVEAACGQFNRYLVAI